MLKTKNKDKKNPNTLKYPKKKKNYMLYMGSSNSKDCWFLTTNHGRQQTVVSIF